MLDEAHQFLDKTIGDEYLRMPLDSFELTRTGTLRVFLLECVFYGGVLTRGLSLRGVQAIADY